MTTEEKLKPGDIVLAYVELVREDPGADGHWHGKTCTEPVYLFPEDMHSVHERARRKFRKGDVVRNDLLKSICFVIDDETDKKSVRISAVEGSDCGAICAANSLTLICPVEERTDRKEGV